MHRKEGQLLNRLTNFRDFDKNDMPLEATFKWSPLGNSMADTRTCEIAIQVPLSALACMQHPRFVLERCSVRVSFMTPTILVGFSWFLSLPKQVLGLVPRLGHCLSFQIFFNSSFIVYPTCTLYSVATDNVIKSPPLPTRKKSQVHWI
jgi:hypothetical protein